MVKKFFKWLGIVAAGLVGFALLGLAYIYIASEIEFNRRYAVTTSTPPALPGDAAEIEEGHRLATLAGCNGCHLKDLSGQAVLDIPRVVRFVAPNLTMTKYTDAELFTLLRAGVKPDGRSVFFMPSESFRHLNDRDLARIIAWMRSMPRVAGITEKTEIRIVGRFVLATGKFKSAAGIAEQFPAGEPADLGSAAGRGRYYAMSFCSECHAQDLNGRVDAKSPPLAVARAYTVEDLSKLLHEGVALGGRELELMSRTSRGRFAVFTSAEISDLHAFLQSRP
jgi:cytochrome c553